MENEEGHREKAEEEGVKSMPRHVTPRDEGSRHLPQVNLFSHIKWSKGDQQASIYLSVNIFTSLHSFPEDTRKTDKTGNAYDVPDLSIDLPWYTDSISVTF